MCKQGFRKLSSHRQTDTTKIILPLARRFAGGQKVRLKVSFESRGSISRRASLTLNGANMIAVCCRILASAAVTVHQTRRILLYRRHEHHRRCGEQRLQHRNCQLHTIILILRFLPPPPHHRQQQQLIVSVIWSTNMCRDVRQRRRSTIV